MPPNMRRQGAACKADAVCRNVLGYKDPGAGYLAAHRCALHNAQEDKCDRGPHAKLGVDRQQAHPGCRGGHHQDAEGKHPLSAEQIAKMGDEHAPQWTYKIADREDAVGLHLAQPVRDIRRKEQLSQCLGKENENDKVVEFQGPAERGQCKGPIVARGQWTL